MGRGAAVNGNGNGRSVLPPAVASPVSVYRQPPPPRRSGLALARRILLGVLATVVMFAAALAGGAYLFYHQSIAEVTKLTPADKLAAKKLDAVLPGQPTTALVIGYDHRAGIERNLDSRSDTVMLVHADPATKSISLLSFPRDLVVEDHCPGRPLFRDRINAAYSVCGPKGTVQTIKDLTGLPINYLITVDFHGFKQVVDKLGGVWIDVDHRYFNDNAGLTPGYNTYATIDLQPGYQRLDGSNALDYVRYRHEDSDVIRVVRQQTFVKALKQQVGQSFSYTKLPGLVKAITHNVVVAQGGGGSLSGSTVLGYAYFAYALPPGHFFQSKIGNLQPYGPSNAELVASPSDVQSAVRQFTNPDVHAPESATAVALHQKARHPTLKPSQVTITVLNGNGVVGAASNAGYELGQRGYAIVQPPASRTADAPSRIFQTAVYYDSAQTGSKVAARRVASLFGDATAKPGIPADLEPLTPGSMLVVVVGQTFHGDIAAASVDQTPKSQPAEVASSDAARPLLEQERARVPFPLETPTLVESHSTLANDSPIRVYTLARHRAVRLTFSTGMIGDYWGIQETDWPDAPVLAGPNSTHVLKGRTYDLYYVGPHLHMVVLRAGGASYWVVNTLLDSLSNETMLAIAKGLRPLPR